MSEIFAISPTSEPARERPPEPREVRMRHAAAEFEAVFLSEMLKHAGLGRMGEGLNGGPGEAAFADMLTQEYARGIVRAGGLGLADSVYQAMRTAGE